MAEGRAREAWEHTSSLLWMQAELNRDSKKRTKPFQPADFNPYRLKGKPPEAVKHVTMAEAKAIFKGL